MNRYAIADMMVMSEESDVMKHLRIMWNKFRKNHDIVIKTMFELSLQVSAKQYYFKNINEKGVKEAYIKYASGYYRQLGDLKNLWETCDVGGSHVEIELCFARWVNVRNYISSLEKLSLYCPSSYHYTVSRITEKEWLEYAFQMEHRKPNEWSAKIYDALNKPVDATRVRTKLMEIERKDIQNA